MQTSRGLILDTQNCLPKDRVRPDLPGLDHIHEIRLEDVSFSYIGDEKVLIAGDEVAGGQAFPEIRRELIRLDFQ